MLNICKEIAMQPAARSETASPIDAFLESRAETCNAASQTTYAAYLRPFAAWLGDRPISSALISAYLIERRRSGLASATLGNCHRMLKTLCRWLVEYGYIEADPFQGPGRVRPPAHKRKRRRVYSEDEVVALLITAQQRIDERMDAQKWRPSGNPFLLRDAQQARALILLLCDSALRAAEVCALDCRHVRAGEFIVLSKGGHEDAAFMTPATRSALVDLAGERPDSDPLFLAIDQGRCTTRALRGMIQRLARAADVHLPPRPLHAFRHLAARQWLKAGLGDLTIRQLMRHQDLATTRIYTELDAAELASLHMQASPINRLIEAAKTTTRDKTIEETN
jgi:site-specific recombinase XerD